jgi:transcriptional regulator with XRE-family HTH domain
MDRETIVDVGGVVTSADNSERVDIEGRRYDHFGMEMRRLRMAQGMSLADLAELIPCHRGTLANIETGRRRPSMQLAMLCDRYLGAGGRLADLLAPLPDRSGEDGALMIGVEMNGTSWMAPVSRRKLLELGVSVASLGYAAAPAKVREVNQGELAALFEGIRGLCQQVPPQTALPLVISQARRLQGLMAVMSGEARRTVQSISVHFGLYVGKLFQEAGDVAAASQWTSMAAEWADQSGERAASAWILIRQAMLSLYFGDGNSAVHFARQAQAVPDIPDRILGMALLREALGHSRLHDEMACFRALNSAGELLKSRDSAPSGLAAFEGSFVDDHHAMTTAWCRHDLGYPAQAADLFDIQLAKVPARAHRTHARFGARMALASAAAGELERACDLTWRLIPAIEYTASATVRIDLRRLARVLSKHRHESMVRKLLPEINAVLVPATMA